MGLRTGRPRGRPKGSPNKASIARQRAIAESGLTPLDYLLSIMRDEKEDPAARREAAKAAAPYVHPKQSSVQMSGGLTVSHEERLARLE